MKESRSIYSSLRIIWAIARKDIVDAIKNKTVLSVLGSVVFIVVMYKFLPYLDGGSELPNLLLYDAGESALAVLTCDCRLAATSSSACFPLQFIIGTLPAVWSAPCAVSIIVIPVTSMTRGS